MNYGKGPNKESIPIAVDSMGRIIISPWRDWNEDVEMLTVETEDVETVTIESPEQIVSLSWRQRFSNWLDNALSL